MSKFESYLSVFVSASSQRDGVVISVKNVSDDELLVRFPNPYTGIRLYTMSGDPVTIGRTVVCWEESDPIVALSPGSSASALTSLVPFWFDLHGVFLAKCSLNVSFRDGESETVVVEGYVDLELKPYRIDRTRRSEFMPGISNNNVSKFVSIIPSE